MTSMLDGLRIVNTRAAHQAGDFDALIQERGGQPISYPCIDIVSPADTSELDDALQVDHDWLVLTSQNVVITLAKQAENLGLVWNGIQVAAIGSSTAQAARDLLGLTVDLVPDEYVAEALAAAVVVRAGTRVLLPQSAIARPVLYETLQKAGAQVTAVTAYQTVRGSGGVNMMDKVKAGQVDVVTLTSPSTARYFVERLADEGGTLNDPIDIAIAAIGPVTARAASKLGMDVRIMPDEYTLDGLLNSIAAHFYVE